MSLACVLYNNLVTVPMSKTSIKRCTLVLEFETHELLYDDCYQTIAIYINAQVC